MKSPESKQNFALIRDRILSQEGKEYWRSVEEFVDAPEFAEFVSREYPHEIETWDNSLSRRNFVKVMGASLALAGLTGCVIQPPEKIVPYVRNPEGMLPGRPNFFATAMTLGGTAMGLLAKAYEGRPIKVEGNPDHPNSRGATDVLAQASILGMYDPDRSQEVLYRGNSSTWERFVPAFRSALDENRADGGAGVRFLTETVTSPTLIDQFNKLKAELPNAKWIQYEPINADNATAGAKMAFGSAVQTIYKIDKATRILSLDADIFSSFNVGYIKDFAAGRKYSEEKKDINRLYVVESSITITGAKADHRLAVKPSELSAVTRAIAAAVGVAGGASNYSGAGAAWIAAMAKDLVGNKGKSLVIAGDTAPPVVHALAHAMNAALGNVGQTVMYADPFSPNTDRTQLDQYKELVGDIDAGKVKMLVILGGNPVYNTPADIRLSAERIAKVPLRVHLGQHNDETAEQCHWHVNEKHYLESWSDTRAHDGTVTITQPLIEPLYGGKNIHEVVQVAFKENFDKKDYDIIREYWQRTNITPAAAAAPAKAASAVAGESGKTAGAPAGDAPKTEAKVAAPAANTAKATPVANTTATPSSNVASKANTNSNSPQATTNGAIAGGAAATAAKFDDNWKKAVHDGVIPNTAAQPKTMTANTAFLSQPDSPVASGGLEIGIRRDPCVYDGRFSNNGWLQELPNPLNKVTWANVGLISPNTAKRLGINQTRDEREIAGASQGTTFINTKGGNLFSDLVTLKMQGSDIQKPVPMWISPGQPDDVITIFMGYGRTRAGRVGNGLGYNAFDVRRSDAMDTGTGDIVKTGGTETIASTQTHFNMEGRDLLRVWDLESFNADPEMGHQHDEYPSSMFPYEEHQQTYNQNHKWAMTIDINSCVGCNACVVACQSENNIAVVGKEQVERHRMMHWLRVDAYY
ncbi:MAG TPA: TAT-variant-translocated molybdopterin oxidoreductase, partial [Pyrinomonadaceae bacterium]|nr:TAT-variant-translocated molybdopterin oxidoreductase [Pyrinomonadaceae bacterium]